MVSVRVKTRTGVRNIIQVYATDSSYLDEQHQYVLDLQHLKITAFQMGEKVQVHGDFNAKVGGQHSSWPEVAGNFGLGRANDRGQ